MALTNIIIKLDSLTCAIYIPIQTSISDLYDIVEKKTNTKIKKTHSLKLNGKVCLDDKLLSDYNISDGIIMYVQYSLCRAENFRDPDLLGEHIYSQFIKDLASQSNQYSINIISLMSYNVDTSNIKKMILQQTQYPTIRKELKKMSHHAHEININVILTDRNFIEYNKRELNCFFPVRDVDLDIEYTPQIDTLCQIQIDENFLEKSKLYSNRITKYSIPLEKTKIFNLVKIPGLDKSNILLNFYYVGLIFENTTNIPDKSIYYGIDYSSLVPFNLHVLMWTGYEFT